MMNRSGLLGRIKECMQLGSQDGLLGARGQHLVIEAGQLHVSQLRGSVAAGGGGGSASGSAHSRCLRRSAYLIRLAAAERRELSASQPFQMNLRLQGRSWFCSSSIKGPDRIGAGSISSTNAAGAKIAQGWCRVLRARMFAHASDRSVSMIQGASITAPAGRHDSGRPLRPGCEALQFAQLLDGRGGVKLPSAAGLLTCGRKRANGAGMLRCRKG